METPIPTLDRAREHRLRRNLTVWLAIAISLVAGGRFAQADEVAEALSAGAEIEARLLAAEMLRYTELRRAAESAMSEYRTLDLRLDRALVAETQPADELRTLEAQVTAARDTAYGLARQSETLRRTIYTQMDRVAELRGAGDRFAARRPKSPLEGVWSLSTSAGEEGHARFSVDGALVRGTYRFDADTSGSLRGTFVDNTVELEQISGGHGFDRLLTGNLEGDQLEGRWVATEVSGGAPESGTWTARKLTASEARGVGALP